MTKKRFFGVAFSAIMIFVLLIGCSKDNVVSLNGVNGDNSDEKITITWLGPPYAPTSQEGTIPEKLLEERFNVEIKPIFYSQENYNEKKTMLMAGGEIPDLVYIMDPRHLHSDANQNFIMKLPYETIKKYAPTVFAELNKEAPEAWLYSHFENDNYGLPNMSINNAYSRITVWRTDWLKKFGINKVPETLDEMHEALYKFRHNDPDRNGKKDTYGMSGDIKAWHTMFGEIFGAYGVLPFNWMNEGDNVVYGGLKPETKEALKLIAQWYAEDLIHPDFITDSVFTTGKDKFVNGMVGYINQHGGYFDLKHSASLPNLLKQTNPDSEIENARPPRGPDGKAGSHIWGKPYHILAIGAPNQKDPAKVARILSIFEGLITDEELFVGAKIGVKDRDWTYYDQTAGLDGGIKYLPPYDDPVQEKNECFSTQFGVPSFFVPIASTFEIYQKYQSKAVKDVRDKYSSMDLGMSDAFMKPDVLPSSSEYFEDLRTKQINIMVQIIRGEKDIESYAEFENIWQTQGGATLEEEAQQCKSTLEQIYKKVGLSKP